MSNKKIKECQLQSIHDNKEDFKKKKKRQKQNLMQIQRRTKTITKSQMDQEKDKDDNDNNKVFGGPRGIIHSKD